MTIRKLETMINEATCRSASIYRDTEFQEYIVRFSIAGIHQTAEDYFTDSREDAQQTARTVMADETTGQALQAAALAFSVDPSAFHWRRLEGTMLAHQNRVYGFA